MKEITPGVDKPSDYIQAVKAGSGEILGWRIIRSCKYKTRYGKTISLKVSDPLYNGADYAKDVVSFGHPLHDVVCRDGVFNDQTECTNWQASMILKDVMKAEGYWFRCRSWFIGTFLFGGKKLNKF